MVAPTQGTGGSSSSSLAVEPAGSQRVFCGAATSKHNTALTVTADTAYFAYIGKVGSQITPKHVYVVLTSGGSGAQTAEIGLFSTPLAPNTGNQSVTKITSTGTLGDLTSTGVIGNSSAFSTAIAAGTHLWVGFRSAMASTQPNIRSSTTIGGVGDVLQTAAAGALTGSGPWTGVAQTAAAAVFPMIYATLD